MKKPYFFFLHTLIIAVTMAPLSHAQVKTSTPATAVSTKANASTQNQNKPAPAATPVPAKKPSTAMPANVTAQSPMNPAPAVPPVQPQQPAASTAANVTTPATKTSVAAPASSPALNQAGTYSYNPVGKPDPFRPFIVVEQPKPKAAADKKKDEPLSIFPLQRADTNNYKVVGIVGGDEHRMAIAEDSGKKFYPLLIGTRIGLRNGKVVEILPDRVIVEEYEKNKAKRVILKLRKN